MLSDRLKQIIDYKGISSRAFALKINVSSQSFGKYLQGREPAASILSTIIETFDDISAIWLLTGRGEMIRGEEPKEAPQDIKNLSETVKNLSETINRQSKIIETLTSK